MSTFDNMSLEQMKEYYKNQMLDYNRNANRKNNHSMKTQYRNNTYNNSDYELAIPAMESMEQATPQFTPQPEPQSVAQPSTSLQPNTQPTLSIDEQYQQFVRDHPAKGFLKAQAFTARRTYPVSDVEVEVYKKFGNEKYVIVTLKTDITGQTETISLHTVNKEVSESPSTHPPYSTYDMRATHSGFMPANYYNIPIFDGILSTQAIDLVPLAAAPEGLTEESYYQQETDL